MKKIILRAGIFSLIVFSMLYLYRQEIMYNEDIPGDLYIVCKGDKTVQKFDLSKGEMCDKLALDIEPHEVEYNALTNKLVVTNHGANDNDSARVITLLSGDKLLDKVEMDLVSGYKPHGVVNHMDSLVAVTADKSGELFIVNTNTNKIDKKYKLEHGDGHIITSDGKGLVFVAHHNGYLSIINDKKNVVKSYQIAECLQGVAFDEKNRLLWLTDEKNDQLHVVSLEGKVVKTFSTDKVPVRVVYVRKHQLMVVSCAKSGSIMFFDCKNKSLLETLVIRGKENLIERAVFHTPHPVGMAVHPNQDVLFVSNSNASTVEVIDLMKREGVAVIFTDAIPDGLAVKAKR